MALTKRDLFEWLSSWRLSSSVHMPLLILARKPIGDHSRWLAVIALISIQAEAEEMPKGFCGTMHCKPLSFLGIISNMFLPEL
jgi:hypothetical protein